MKILDSNWYWYKAWWNVLFILNHSINSKSFIHFWPECMKLIIKLKCHKGWYGIWYDKLLFFSKGFRMPQKVLNLKQILAFKHILFYKYDAQDIWYFKRRFAASIVITHILRKEKVYPSVYFVFKPYYRLNHLVK